MSGGAVYVAKCWECGWSSPECESEAAAWYWVGSHAISAGCPIGRVRTIRTSEVES